MSERAANQSRGEIYRYVILDGLIYEFLDQYFPVGSCNLTPSFLRVISNSLGYVVPETDRKTKLISCLERKSFVDYDLFKQIFGKSSG